MNSYSRACIFFIFFWTCSAALASEDSMTSCIIENHLPVDHPCLSVRYESNVDINKLMGRWFVLTLLCHSWGRIPMCDTVEFQVNNSQIQERWTSLDLLDHPSAANTADYTTLLNVVESGVWVDTRPDRGYPVYLVLSSWHPFYAVLLRCYPNTPGHSQDMFILSRYMDHIQRDLDMFIDLAKAQGVDPRLNTQYILWSMCEKHLHKL